jgi:hypothetical protein
MSDVLKVDGVRLSTPAATGGFDIAGGEVGQDPVTSLWEDDDAGWPGRVLWPRAGPGWRRLGGVRGRFRALGREPRRWPGLVAGRKIPFGFVRAAGSEA